MLALEAAPANSKNARRGHRGFFRRSRRGPSTFSRSVARGWDGCRYDVAPDRLLGRWVQRDPIGYHDGMGLYEYVRSSPLRGLDPRGLMEEYPSTSYAQDKEEEKKCNCSLKKDGIGVSTCEIAPWVGSQWVNPRTGNRDNGHLFTAEAGEVWTRGTPFPQKADQKPNFIVLAQTTKKGVNVKKGDGFDSLSSIGAGFGGGQVLKHGKPLAMGAQYTTGTPAATVDLHAEGATWSEWLDQSEVKGMQEWTITIRIRCKFDDNDHHWGTIRVKLQVERK